MYGKERKKKKEEKNYEHQDTKHYVITTLYGYLSII
jgi:hypothetical protein